MLTSNELVRIRRQMQRRIRVVLAQRRVEAPAHSYRAERSGGSSAEPAPED
ncbi:MAG TPA: hypothetical protein VIL37_08315 [Natronosporangium sp.]